MAPKRPRLTEVADEIARIGRTSAQTPGTASSPDRSVHPRTDVEEPAAYWHKATYPFRADQLQDLKDIIARWAVEKQVRVSEAEVIRLALDRVLTEMQIDPDTTLLALYAQEQQERERVPSRKFGRSQGLARYLKRKGLV